MQGQVTNADLSWRVRMTHKRTQCDPAIIGAFWGLRLDSRFCSLPNQGALPLPRLGVLPLLRLVAGPLVRRTLPLPRLGVLPLPRLVAGLLVRRTPLGRP